MIKTNNFAVIEGYVGQDPIIKRFDNGGMVVHFTIATSDSYTNKNGDKVVKTQWHNMVVRQQQIAEFVERYVKKGSLLNTMSTIEYREYEKDGTTKKVTELIVESLRFVPREKRESNVSGTVVSQTEDQSPGDDDSDLPY